MNHVDLLLSTFHALVVSCFHMWYLVQWSSGRSVRPEIYIAVHAFTVCYCVVDTAFMAYGTPGLSDTKKLQFMFHHLVLIGGSGFIMLSVGADMSVAWIYSLAWQSEWSTLGLNYVLLLSREHERIPPGVAVTAFTLYVLLRPVLFGIVSDIVYHTFGLSLPFAVIYLLFCLNFYWTLQLGEKVHKLRVSEPVKEKSF